MFPRDAGQRGPFYFLKPRLKSSWDCRTDNGIALVLRQPNALSLPAATHRGTSFVRMAGVTREFSCVMWIMRLLPRIHAKGVGPFRRSVFQDHCYCWMWLRDGGRGAIRAIGGATVDQPVRNFWPGTNSVGWPRARSRGFREIVLPMLTYIRGRRERCGRLL